MAREGNWRVPWRWLLLLLVLGAAGTYVYVFEQARIVRLVRRRFERVDEHGARRSLSAV